MKVLELKKVNKIYNGSEVHVHAVNNVTLEFQEAEFAAVVGPSGSGKTYLRWDVSDSAWSQTS